MGNKTDSRGRAYLPEDTNFWPLRVLLAVPFGNLAGGVVQQTNGLLEHWRKHDGLSLDVVNTAPLWRGVLQSGLVRRVVGGTMQAWFLHREVNHRLEARHPECLYVASSGSLGMLRDFDFLRTARQLGIPASVTLHTGAIPTWVRQNNILFYLLRMTCSAANGIVVLDAASEECLKKIVSRPKVSRIPNGVDTDWIARITSRACHRKVEPLRVVFVGWVIPAKGTNELVTACAQLSSPNFELRMVGPVVHSYQEELTRVAQMKDGGKWLSFAGSLSHEEAIKEMSSGDVFVLPSHTEGFPVSLLEAMAAGKAAIGTSVGAIPELLAPEGQREFGLCIPARNVEALRSALANLLADGGRRLAMGANAQLRARERYGLGKVALEYVRLWQDLAFKRIGLGKSEAE